MDGMLGKTAGGDVLTGSDCGHSPIKPYTISE